MILFSTFHVLQTYPTHNEFWLPCFSIFIYPQKFIGKFMKTKYRIQVIFWVISNYFVTKVFPSSIYIYIYVYIRFRKGKSLKDYLVRETLSKMGNAGGSEPWGKGACQVCDHIITTNTFTTKAYGEAFNIQSGPLICNS